MAAETLAAGPPAWSAETVEARRYAISEMAESLRGGRAGDRLAEGSALYGALGEFATGVAGRWGGSGKGLAVALREMDSVLAAEMNEAFRAVFAGEGDAGVQAVVDRVLRAAGGRLRVGFAQRAPGDWRR